MKWESRGHVVYGLDDCSSVMLEEGLASKHKQNMSTAR